MKHPGIRSESQCRNAAQPRSRPVACTQMQLMPHLRSGVFYRSELD